MNDKTQPASEKHFILRERLAALVWVLLAAVLLFMSRRK
jgi:hypothetical protein